ncbi:hypothetical protein LUZ60_006084 [Juncus effusus]|nr:hypothetical protein LUZ60_006084 [Juncus effusus]
MAEKLSLRNFYSDYSNLPSNTYKQAGGLYEETEVEKSIDVSDSVHNAGKKLSQSLPSSGREDINVLTMQRLEKHVPSTPLDMVVDYYNYDYEFAEPPRVTSLQNTNPLPTFANFGEHVHFVADQRGYVSVVYDVASQFLQTNESSSITDSRVLLNKVVRSIKRSNHEVVVETEDGSTFKADYVMVCVSVGVLQTNLIRFEPDLPQLEKEYPGENVLVVTVTDEESRRIEQEPDSQIKVEAMQVLRNMFGEDIPDATDILVPRWWSNRFFRGSFSNWPVGLKPICI